MILNEAEAQERLCCGSGFVAATHCIGGACMGWRWMDKEPLVRRRRVSDERFVERNAQVNDLPDEEWEAAYDALSAEIKAFSGSWAPEPPEPGMTLEGISAGAEKGVVVATFVAVTRARRGFCGLAGRPEF